MKGAKVNGLQVVYRSERKPVVSVQASQTVCGAAGLREATTGMPVVVGPVEVLRKLWAVAEGGREPGCESADAAAAATHEGPERRAHPLPELAFYRKYTEAMLRRYLRMSMEAGRTPSLLGRELFRAKVTSYRVHSFEDVVIFCYDMEKCLGKLQAADQELIKRVGLQEYTHMETAGLLGISLRAVTTKYAAALDRLTAMLLAARLLEPLGKYGKAVKPLNGLSR